MRKTTKRVQVVGDLFKEHNIYRGSRLTPDAPGFNGTAAITTTDGAELLYKILSTTCDAASGDGESKISITVERGYDKDLLSTIPANLAGYSIWEQTPSDSGNESDVWRMIQHLGYGNLAPDGHRSQLFDCPKQKTGKAPVVLAVEDAGFGYRFKTAEKGGPGASCQGIRANRNGS